MQLRTVGLLIGLISLEAYAGTYSMRRLQVSPEAREACANHIASKTQFAKKEAFAQCGLRADQRLQNCVIRTDRHLRKKGPDGVSRSRAFEFCIQNPSNAFLSCFSMGVARFKLPGEESAQKCLQNSTALFTNCATKLLKRLGGEAATDNCLAVISLALDAKTESVVPINANQIVHRFEACALRTSDIPAKAQAEDCYVQAEASLSPGFADTDTVLDSDDQSPEKKSIRKLPPRKISARPEAEMHVAP